MRNTRSPTAKGLKSKKILSRGCAFKRVRDMGGEGLKSRKTTESKKMTEKSEP